MIKLLIHTMKSKVDINGNRYTKTRLYNLEKGDKYGCVTVYDEPHLKLAEWGETVTIETTGIPSREFSRIKVDCYSHEHDKIKELFEKAGATKATATSEESP